ncbi:hypothetical protein B9Z55_021455 [Caenorhabditis nigoni]|uniref:C2H2-type domain-containing protein n=1 Tax=Caenorhabditis nigoni TaxID=1611254 RepID=A0A2G5TSY8_9PELO|nr:hypothetical protein B9Z55_021455 [Caenorhabditis nigoni]
MEVVVKPPPGDALYKLVAFLEENRLEFYVNISEPIKEAPTSSQASEDIDFSAAEIPKITSNESEISDKPTCKICHKKIQKANDYYRKKHVLHHLKFKTWKCTVCSRLFFQSSSGRAHSRDKHPEVPYTRLVEKMFFLFTF